MRAGLTTLAERVRKDFPALAREIHGKRLVYLDNAATTQKPRAVVEALTRYYLHECANVHRGVHWLSERATEEYENARHKVRRFLNASYGEEIIFVRGATEGINLVAQSFVRPRLKPGDEVLITAMEHHSNIVPWQLVTQEKGARLRVAPITDEGELVIEELERLLGPKTKLLALTHVSNALGTVNPVKKIVALAHERGVPVLVDGAQATPHLPVDMQDLGCDFYVFSGHKVYGPTGIGVLYGRREWLEQMPPYQGGGDMIRSVTFERTIFNELPYKFEAGTPHISGAIGLGAALDYVEAIGREEIRAWEGLLVEYAVGALREVDGVRLLGRPRERAAVVSFILKGLHPHDVATVLDHEGVAVRAGHHCAQPAVQRFGVPASLRASFAMYNTVEEIDILVKALQRAEEILS